MTTASASLAVNLAEWPGVVLRVSHEGVVTESNGVLESELHTPALGHSMESLLDETSHAKWQRMQHEPAAPGRAWELVFSSGAYILDTCAVSILSADDGGWWLVQHPRAPGLDAMSREVTAVNTELSGTQRSLVIEQARLAQALEELERSNTALDEFAHVVSHDLKAPLRAIREYAELLVSHEVTSTEEERASDVQRILVLVNRMRGMIDSALHYARAGRNGDHVEQFDSGAVMHEIVEYLAPPAGVNVVIAPGMPEMEAERVPFEQVFRNLISNAIAHRRAGGAHIEVSASDAGTHWEFLVADDGPGIPASQQPMIFRLFHTTRPGDGSGVGLALVKRIVESQGGSVRVESAQGAGASFFVRWPKRAPATSRPSGNQHGAAR